MAKRLGQNFGIRYSEAFKMAVVRELEEGDLVCEAVRGKYGIKGCFTVQAWVRKYGNGSRGIRIRVEKPGKPKSAANQRFLIPLWKSASVAADDLLRR